MNPLLQIKGLQISLRSVAGAIQAVRSINVHLHPGEIVGLVGESGSGKSVTAQAILQLLPPSSILLEKGEIWLDGEDLMQKSQKEMESIRGKKVGMIFQDPLTALNPMRKIGPQLMEGMRKQLGLSKKEAYDKALTLLTAVGLSPPEQRMQQYPFELSGGMRQRVLIAIAIACDPLLLIADEPTTALDPTTQQQILALLQEIRDKRHMSILLITHDLSIVESVCDRVLVMYAGKIVEEGAVTTVFAHPHHPYTQALLQVTPSQLLNKKSRLQTIIGRPPNLLHPPKGCAFHPRCPQAMPICCLETPEELAIAEKQHTTCWLYRKKD